MLQKLGADQGQGSAGLVMEYCVVVAAVGMSFHQVDSRLDHGRQTDAEGYRPGHEDGGQGL
jgi:hypothetical protein